MKFFPKLLAHFIKPITPLNPDESYEIFTNLTLMRFSDNWYIQESHKYGWSYIPADIYLDYNIPK